MSPRPLVIIESPFTASASRSQDDNLQYLRRCLRDSWKRGENPFASHAFYPLFLHESIPLEREEGIKAGYEYWNFAESIIFYIDFGMSPGMNRALKRAQELGETIPIIIRTLGDPK